MTEPSARGRIVITVRGEVQSVLGVDPERSPVKLWETLMAPGSGVIPPADVLVVPGVLDVTEDRGADRPWRRTIWRLP